MSPAGDMQVFRSSSTLRIHTLSDDQLHEQIVSGLPETHFGSGMGGSGGTYVTQDGSILTLSANIQSIIDNPTIDLGSSGLRAQVDFEAVAQLLVKDDEGQYYVADTISLGRQNAGTYGEFLSRGLLTLQNPHGGVTMVNVVGHTLTVNHTNSPQGSKVVSLPNELLVIQDDQLSRWTFAQADQFENVDVIFKDLDRLDVNEDGYVTALDALIVINVMNRGDAESEPLISIMPSADTSGDGVVSSLDALRIINRLNANDSSVHVADAMRATTAVLPQLRDDWIDTDDRSRPIHGESQLF